MGTAKRGARGQKDVGINNENLEKYEVFFHSRVLRYY
jgi:hypothetical protein